MSAEVESQVTPDSKKSESGGLGREIRTVLLPSLVTGVFGFLIWNAQTTIQQSVNESNQKLERESAREADRDKQMMQTMMARGEEVYKRKLALYEQACKNIAAIRKALDEAELVPESKTRASDKLAELDELHKANALYWSDDIEKQLSKLWGLSVDKLRSQQSSNKAANDLIKAEIASLHQQMKDDLALDDVTKATR